LKNSKLHYRKDNPMETTNYSIMSTMPTLVKDAFETIEQATRECPTCGAVEPRCVIWRDVTRYRTTLCPCEREAEQRARKEKERQEMLATSYKITYGWLSSGTYIYPFRDKTFATFEPSKQPEAYEIAKLWASKPQGALILYGPYGVGKTHLLSAIISAALEEQKIESLFMTPADLFKAIQERIQSHEHYTTLIDRAIATPLLVIDDVDKLKPTDFRLEVYFDIIDKRVIKGRPIAISTNRLDELASFVGGAVADRLNVGQIAVEMVGESYRKQL
jgi:DNA replication protein DnaC